MPDQHDLKSKILYTLEQSPGSPARDISNQISEDRRTVNQFLHGANGISVRQDSNFLWYLHDRVQRMGAAAAATPSKDRPAAQTPERRPELVNDTSGEYDSSGLITNVLQSLRRRLLDLTARNRLLNFRHTKTGCIRIIDEMPDQLKQFLADSENEMRFMPVPDPRRHELIEAGHIEVDPETDEEKVIHKPTAKEWAEWLGLHTKYESPEANSSSDEDKHSDNAIQTLLFPDELETRLRSMRQKANSAIEETGANILYLSIGFLEWFESKDLDKKRLAPLYMIPVRLERGKLNAATRTYEYRLQYSGEDVLTNISLREKLHNDFAIALPELEDSVDPEEYIASVAQAVSSREPNWRVRRYVTLGHLNFSKQLLYLDLDLANWPEDDNLIDHSLVKQCLAGLSEAEDDDSGSGAFVEEHLMDDIDEIHTKYPLIDNADSSQHSALIDAVDGKNLVIEGPPGTGKSQTITNLIAAALANGKRVLFVAEKVAALEVVKRRLDQAGLGDFCLELHSHRSQKRRVLDDIGERIKRGKRLRKPAEIDTDIAIFEELKTKLRDHANQINSKWKATDRSIHQILSSATRYRNELGADPDALRPENINGDTFTPIDKKRVIGQARSLATVYQGIIKQLGDPDSIAAHPWYGVRKTSLQAFDQDKVVKILVAWQGSLESTLGELAEFAEPIDGSIGELPCKIHEICSLTETIDSLPECTRSDPLFALPKLRGGNAKALATAIQLYKAIFNHFEDLAQHLSQRALTDLENSDSLIESSCWIGSVATLTLTLVKAREAIHVAKSLEQSVVNLRDPVDQVNAGLGLSGSNILDLSVNGIGRLSRIADIVAMLQTDYLTHRSECFDLDELDQIIPRLSADHRALISSRDELKDVFDIESAPDLDRIEEMELEFRQAGFFSFLSSEWRAANNELKAIRASKRVKTRMLRDRFKDLAQYIEAKQAFESDEAFKQYLPGHFQGLKTDVRRIEAMRAWYKCIRDEYGAGFGSTVAVGDAIIAISDSLARAVRSLHKKGIHQESDRIAKELKFLSESFPGLPALNADSAKLDTSPDIATLAQDFPAHFALTEKAFVDEQANVENIGRVVGRLEKLIAYIRKWAEINICSGVFDGKVRLAVNLGKYDESTLRGLERVSRVASTICSTEFPASIASKLYKEPSKATIDLIRLKGRMLSESVRNERRHFEVFRHGVDLDPDSWNRGSDDLHDLIDRNRNAIENPEWLPSWLEFLRARELLADLGWSTLARGIEDGTISPSQVDGAVFLGAYDTLAREIIKEIPELSKFSGLSQIGMQEQFQEYDDSLRDLQRQLIAWKASRVNVPKGVSSGRVRDYTQMSLLEHEIGKKSRHIPLRQLMRRSGDAISTLKPCFMMGPMSVAQYLQPGHIKFDLVIMDEASQVRPEDALGAVARGSQLVVVGDPKQLPPTSFFDKILDEEDEEEDFTAGQQSESILDAARSSFPQRRLRWHYRSQHESLIAFSNHEFYGSDLVIFPSPTSESPEYGVQFTRVKRGRFVNRVNREEAALIAKSVRQHMLTSPDESIGVVAMSAQQREQIERAIEQETKEDAQFRDLVDQDQSKNEPLFVKNLENVQGDERDVIYISMTYGPVDVNGKVAQRFGPINSIHGWRRLNVLFTRSKKRMHVFSSMGSEDIVISETSSRGVKSLKAFLDYAAYGHLSTTIEHTGRDPDSDFEIAVADALSNHGFECVPQVGVAGYFLDIAVKDPGNGGRYLMAIECDGATYHSAKSTRDRDRLRQKILEGLGWRVRRIWSTDWFSNSEGQLAPIVKELNELKTVPVPHDEAEFDEAQGIEEIADEIEEDTDFVATIVESDLDLKTQLEQFNTDVIRVGSPETPDSRRFLRPAMIEALLTYLPTTTWEFHQKIPQYLREGTEPMEGKYIEPVVQIIYEAEG